MLGLQVQVTVLITVEVSISVNGAEHRIREGRILFSVLVGGEQ